MSGPTMFWPGPRLSIHSSGRPLRIINGESHYPGSSIESHPPRIINRESLYPKIIYRESSESSIESHFTEGHPSRVFRRESAIESHLNQDHPSRVINRESSIESHQSRVINRESSIESHLNQDHPSSCPHQIHRSRVVHRDSRRNQVDVALRIW